MKTTNIIPANTASNTRARIHAFMVFAGIMTVIICSLVLLQETQPETSKFATTLPAIKFKGLSVFSTVSKMIRM
jgi:hypothetical protein